MAAASVPFEFYLPLKKNIADSDLLGIASTTSVDRDDERMSENALRMMVADIKRLGVNLFEDHEHGWQHTLGVIHDAELVNKQVQVKIRLDDATTNPKVPALLNKLKKGIRLGLSVGGKVTAEKWERVNDKRIKIIDGVKLYEVSVVGIPSNADSFVSIPQAIMKNMKKAHELPIYQIRGKKYYRDVRLGEYRAVDDPSDSIPIDDVSLGELEKPDEESPGNGEHRTYKSCPVCYSKAFQNDTCELCFWKNEPHITHIKYDLKEPQKTKNTIQKEQQKTPVPVKKATEDEQKKIWNRLVAAGLRSKIHTKDLLPKCPFCQGNAAEVLSLEEDREKSNQCLKCGARFSQDKTAKSAPFQKRKRNLTEAMLAFEAGELSEEEVIDLFQELVNSGMAWQLQGSYGRTAAAMISDGIIKLPKGKKIRDAYGNEVTEDSFKVRK
jgi:HK97 family phage prohead protease